MDKKFTIIILSLIGVTLGALFYTDGLRFQFGSNQHHAEQTLLFSGYIASVTGELLMSRNAETLPVWQNAVAYTRTLDFRLYDFTYQPLQKLFQQMARAGVKIRGIIENQLYGNNSKNFNKLHKIFTGVYHIDIHSDEALHDNFMHAKTFVTDDAFIIQTANLGYASFFNNREFFFISHDRRIRDNLEKLFAKDRAGQKIIPEDIEPELLICPIDCRAKTEAILSGAKHSIWMYQQYIVDPAILSLLQTKWGNGETLRGERGNIDMKLIVGDNDQKEDILKTPLQGVTHVWKKPYVHAKMILVDDMYLIVSSINLSANSMDENREIGIVLIDGSIINAFREQFQRDWMK